MSEPTSRRPTGVGWPDASQPAQPSTAQPSPPSSSPPPAPAAESAPADDEFARRAQSYRAQSYRAGAPRRPITLPPARPGTVTAAAVILFISAGLAALACGGVNLLAGQAGLTRSEQTLLLMVSALFGVIAVTDTVLGYYILQGRQWARITTIVLSAISIAVGLIGAIAAAGSGADGGAGSCFGIIVNGVVIGLLSGSTAAEYFRAISD
ncbi:MAG TPA: hypothetical protein VIL37_20545 [Natronosporangium sp.]